MCAVVAWPLLHFVRPPFCTGAGRTATAPESPPEFGGGVAVWSPMASCDSETESPGSDEVRFEYTNPTFCSRLGSADTAPEMTLIID